MSLSAEQIKNFNKIVREVSKVYKGARTNYFGLKGDVLQVNITISKFALPKDKNEILAIFKNNGMKKIRAISQPGAGAGIIIQGVDQ